MDYLLNAGQEYAKFADLSLGVLCTWREARGEQPEVQLAVAYVICNRARKPGWWGETVAAVVAKRLQFSSMTAKGDPNLLDYPNPGEPVGWNAYQSCLQAFLAAYTESQPDPVSGATEYYDASLDGDPPEWAATLIHVCDIGRMRFYR